jgi:hypothetical protein
MTNTKTYQVYEVHPSFPNNRWRAVISDVFTGQVDQSRDFASEEAGKSWAEGVINSRAGSVKFDPFYMNVSELDEAPYHRGYGDDYTPPLVEAKPEIAVRCYCCDSVIKADHHWDFFNGDLTLVMAHCGRTEKRTMTLQQAKECAKVGYVAFLT